MEAIYECRTIRQAVGKCIFLLRLGGKIAYWSHQTFPAKKTEHFGAMLPNFPAVY